MDTMVIKVFKVAGEITVTPEHDKDLPLFRECSDNLIQVSFQTFKDYVYGDLVSRNIKVELSR